MAETALLLNQGSLLSSVHAKANIIENANNESFCFVADDEVPIIDYSMLVSADPDHRSKAIQDLGKACGDYGCFTVVNHGLPESFIRGVLEECSGFFDLAEMEKTGYEPKGPADKIRWGKGSKPGDKREFLKLISHPDFQCPAKPTGFSEILQEYCKRTRAIALEIFRGISKSLGLEECYIENAMKLESGFDICGVNTYPPCSLPSNPVGLLPHSDPSLLILLLQNVDGGLQIQRNGEWINTNVAQNSIFAHIGDHLEVLTNGKYKSAMHRVIGNNKVKRIGVPIAFGPSLDAFVKPAREFVDESHRPAYHEQTYEEFWQTNQCNVMEGKLFNKGSALNIDEGLIFDTNGRLHANECNFVEGIVVFNTGSTLNKGSVLNVDEGLICGTNGRHLFEEKAVLGRGSALNSSEGLIFMNTKGRLRKVE
ncbi:hypothetical protein RJ639_008302 [Escallonia herrerae]|uniref:Fe2OG dioxygenase domain-containing protein n=1 Tax=Escallonia herrerae TaxID=1293975 RepID=A0AA88VSY4_9ASTE|nr:hypothetical protein RJ639_008302 [Escallonia herrerae]